MTAAPVVTPTTDLPSNDPPRIAFWPVFAWLAIQMLALLVAGLRVPFSARFPAPEEQLAMHEMIVAQMLASALIFPLLFPTRATAVIVVGSAPLMQQLAGVLSGEVNSVKPMAVGLCAALWLIGLAFWSAVLRTPRARLHGVAVAMLLVVGGVALAYLRREFGAPAETFDWKRHGHLGPLMAALAILEHGERGTRAWAFLGAFLLSSVVAWVALRARAKSAPPVPQTAH